MTAQENEVTRPLGEGDVTELELIELLFFAYRDFTSDPDQLLATYGFGRAHHRRRVLIVDQGQQQVFQGRVFLLALVGIRECLMQGLFKASRE